MKRHEKIKWLEDRGDVTLYDQHADTTATWTDGSRILETGEFFAVETMYCKVQHYLEKNG